MVKKVFFKNFSEYWHFARPLSDKQRNIVYKSLSSEEKEMLGNSYLSDGWSDLICRNEIDRLIDDMKKRYGYDILDIKGKALKGKETYVSMKFWRILSENLKNYKPEFTKYVLHGIKASPCENNPNVVLITSS